MNRAGRLLREFIAIRKCEDGMGPKRPIVEKRKTSADSHSNAKKII